MKHLYTSGADHLTFEGLGGGGGMVDFRENILQTTELFCQENTWGKKTLHWFWAQKNPTKVISCQCIEICVAP